MSSASTHSGCGPTITRAQLLLLGDYPVFQVAVRRITSLAQYTYRAEASGDVYNQWDQNPHAVVMGTGSPKDQFFVGTSVSPMGHIQADRDSIVLGMRKRWWVDDPGYQQYVQTTERGFTVGPTAHNTPVINGQGQVFKLAVIVSEPDVKIDESGTMELTLDLTACYESQCGVRKLERTVWMLPTGNHVVICDVIDTVMPAQVTRH